MPINEQDRKKRAKKAGLASGKKRRDKNKDRDKNICLAYGFLTQEYQKQTDRLQGFKYISSFGRGVNLVVNENTGEKESPLTFLSIRVGVTRQRIEQIVKNRGK